MWIVIFNCTVTRAVYIDLTEDYGTDSILQTLRRFISIRGCPGKIQSDQGSQLIAAAEDIAQLVASWDWEPIIVGNLPPFLRGDQLFQKWTLGGITDFDF